MVKPRQIAVFVNDETSAMIDKLKAETGLSIARLIESAIAAYATSDSLVQILEWRDEVNNRLLALESRLEGVGAAGKGMYAPADKMPVVADLKPSVVAVDAGGETGVGKAGKRQKRKAVEGAEFDALVQEYGAKEGGGFIGINAIIDAIHDAGFQASAKTVGEAQERLKKG